MYILLNVWSNQIYIMFYNSTRRFRLMPSKTVYLTQHHCSLKTNCTSGLVRTLYFIY